MCGHTRWRRSRYRKLLSRVSFSLLIASSSYRRAPDRRTFLPLLRRPSCVRASQAIWPCLSRSPRLPVWPEAPPFSARTIVQSSCAQSPRVPPVQAASVPHFGIETMIADERPGRIGHSSLPSASANGTFSGYPCWQVHSSRMPATGATRAPADRGPSRWGYLCASQADPARACLPVPFSQPTCAA